MQNKKVKKSLNRDRAFPQIYDAINEQMSSFTFLGTYSSLFLLTWQTHNGSKNKVMMNDEIERSRDQELGLIADIVVQLFWIMIWKRVYTVQFGVTSDIHLLRQCVYAMIFICF